MEENEELKDIRRRKLREFTSEALGRGTKSATGKQREPAPNRPVEVTDVTFTEKVKSYPIVVVDCWAPWCAPCRIIAPVIEEMAQDYAGSILFGKLNVDENQGVAMQYQIMSIPTLLVFKNGRLVDRIIGAMTRQMLESKIARHL